MRRPVSPWRTLPGRCLLLVPLLAAVSCSGAGGLHPVRGQVLHNDKPAAGAVVVFHPKGGDLKAQRPSGVTGEDGSFTLMTGKENGAAAGEYAVTVVWPEDAAAPKKGVITLEPPDAKPTDRLKGRYGDPKTTPLSAAVKSGRNNLDPFKLR